MKTVSIPAPASKSLSHRVLMAAALAHGESTLSHVLESDDTARTREILSALGARFIRTGEGAFTVHGISGKVSDAAAPSGEPLSCFVGESGTTCRLITAVLAAGKGRFRVHGAGRMHERPIKELADTLESLGACVRFEGKAGCPPLVLEARGLDASGLPGGMADIGCDESSQYLSGLLLAAPLGKGLLLRLGGSKVVSWPYVSLTLETLERFGLSLSVEEQGPSGQWLPVAWRELKEAAPGCLRFRVPAGTYRAGSYAVEGDWSGASYFLAAGAVGPHPVEVRGLTANSLQGDAALVGILQAMGARIVYGEKGITVFPAALSGVEVDMRHCPDLVPTVAALATHAQGATTIRGAAHLALKESDRLRAPAEELTKMGCTVTVLDDGLIVVPPAKGLAAPLAPLRTHEDHRMAMSLSLLGLPGLTGKSGFDVPLDNPGCVAKSFPHFWDLWQRVRA